MAKVNVDEFLVLNLRIGYVEIDVFAIPRPVVGQAGDVFGRLSIW